jgi:hypothetical protein
VAGIEAYEIQLNRMQQRLKTLVNGKEGEINATATAA